MTKTFWKVPQSLVLVSALTATISDMSYAERLCVHGHSLAVEHPDITSVHKRADGAHIRPRDGSDKNWVHYSIPVGANKEYSAIRIKYKSGYCETLDRVYIYDGAHRFKEAMDPYANDPNPNDDYINVRFNPKRIWNSIGVSIRVASPWDQCPDGVFSIYSVCAFE